MTRPPDLGVQLAVGASGLPHSISSIQSEEDALRFEATMTRQGYQVQRLTSAEAAARFARPAEPSVVMSAEVATEVPIETPDPGTRVRHTHEGEVVTGTVAQVLRWPAGHPHCPNRVAVLVRSPGLDALVEPGALELLPDLDVVPEVATPIEIPPQPRPETGWVQPALW